MIIANSVWRGSLCEWWPNPSYFCTYNLGGDEDCDDCNDDDADNDDDDYDVHG